MDDKVQLRRQDSTRGPLWLVIGSICLWFTLLQVLNPAPIVDEGLHLLVVERFCAGDWSRPNFLPMLPAYHVIAYLPARLLGAELWVLRALSAIMAVLAALLFRAITRHGPAHLSGDSLLHFAWNPLLFPFMVMAYTEMATMLCLVAVVYLHVRSRYCLSAAALLAACLIRQSNIVWVPFMAVWAVVETLRRPSLAPPAGTTGPRQARLRRALSAIAGHVVLLAAAAVLIIGFPNIVVTTVEANRPRFNIAQFYLFAIFVILIWAPVWIAGLDETWRSLTRWAAAHRAYGVSLTATSIVVLAALVVAFDNPHPWNRLVDFIRNWPLLAMSNSLLARIVCVCLIAGFVPVVIRFTRTRPDPLMLSVAWMFSFLYLLPHSLADPRYYIVPVFFLSFFSRFPPIDARRVARWQLAISVIVCAYIAVYGSREGGIW